MANRRSPRTPFVKYVHQLGWSVNKLDDASPLGRFGVKRIATGKYAKGPQPKTIGKLAEFLGVPYEELADVIDRHIIACAVHRKAKEPEKPKKHLPKANSYAVMGGEIVKTHEDWPVFRLDGGEYGPDDCPHGFRLGDAVASAAANKTNLAEYRLVRAWFMRSKKGKEWTRKIWRSNPYDPNQERSDICDLRRQLGLE